MPNAIVPAVKVKPKKKAKAKATSGAASSGGPSIFGGGDQTVVNPDREVKEKKTSRKAKPDIELEKLDLQRRCLVMSTKWRGKLEEMNAEVTLAIDSATPFSECKNLIDILRLRLERMYALLPAKRGTDFPVESEAANFDESRSKDKLSPMSQSKLKALDHPTKASLSEFEKMMTSAEQATNKALTLLNKTCADLQVAAEKERAKEARLEAIRRRKAEESLKMMQAAKKAGEEEAEANGEMSHEDEDGVDEAPAKKVRRGSGRRGARAKAKVKAAARARKGGRDCEDDDDAGGGEDEEVLNEDEEIASSDSESPTGDSN